MSEIELGYVSGITSFGPVIFYKDQDLQYITNAAWLRLNSQSYPISREDAFPIFMEIAEGMLKMDYGHREDMAEERREDAEDLQARMKKEERRKRDEAIQAFINERLVFKRLGVNKKKCSRLCGG